MTASRKTRRADSFAEWLAGWAVLAFVLIGVVVLMCLALHVRDEALRHRGDTTITIEERR
jgi:hypothetical protein